MYMAFFSFSALSKDPNKHFEKKKGKNGQVRRKIFYNDEKYDGGGYKLQVMVTIFRTVAKFVIGNSMTMRNLMVVGTTYR